MLNHEDVSEYLKIGPDGLEVSFIIFFFTFPRLDAMFHRLNLSDAPSKY